MATKFTRHRFLMAAGAGAAYLALTNAVGCEPAERTSKARTTKPRQPARPMGGGCLRTSAFSATRRVGLPLAPRPRPTSRRGNDTDARRSPRLPLRHPGEG